MESPQISKLFAWICVAVLWRTQLTMQIVTVLVFFLGDSINGREM